MCAVQIARRGVQLNRIIQALPTALTQKIVEILAVLANAAHSESSGIDRKVAALSRWEASKVSMCLWSSQHLLIGPC
jgi:hypothetical protein